MPKDPSAINSYASVIVESNVGRALDYEIPSHLLGKVHLGTRVLVPLQNRSVFGMVICLKNRVDFPSIRAIESIASDPLPPPLLSLAKWISSYYCSSLHRIFSSMMPPSVKSNMKAKQEPLFSLQKTKKETADFIASLRRSAPTQGRVLEAL